jgi:hypothetical protein
MSAALSEGRPGHEPSRPAQGPARPGHKLSRPGKGHHHPGQRHRHPGQDQVVRDIRTASRGAEGRHPGPDRDDLRSRFSTTYPLGEPRRRNSLEPSRRTRSGCVRRTEACPRAPHACRSLQTTPDVARPYVGRTSDIDSGVVTSSSLYQATKAPTHRRASSKLTKGFRGARSD